MKLAKIVLCLSAFLLLVGCGKTTTSNDTTKSNTTNAAASPKATADKSPAGTTFGTKVPTPEAAADGLLNAWKTKDETAAAKFAADAAFKKLFNEGGGPEGMESQGCSEDEGTYNCAYTYEGGALIMYVKGNESAGYKVETIEFVAD